MKRLLTNVLIVCAAATMVLAGVPLPARELFRDRLDPAFVTLGLSQEWKLFAPNPTQRDADFAAVVRFADRSTSTFWLPRIETMSFFERMVRERYRKYELNALGSSPELQRDAAHFIARAAASQGRRPVNVTLIEFDRVTSRPEFGRRKELVREVLLDYVVTPDDLR